MRPDSRFAGHAKPGLAMRVARLAGAALVFLGAAGQAHAQEDAGPCGPLKNGYGPYDFRTDRDKLSIVTTFHFTPLVEAVIAGSTGAHPGGDIDYTLRAIPNHPNALISMIRLGEKEKTDQPSGARYTVECYMERALRFRPDDEVVRMIYVTFLISKQRKAEALRQLEVVSSKAQDNPFTYYNLGMLYADMQEYDMALENAHRAYAMGILNPALKEKLQAAGHWTESSGASEAVTSAASSASQPLN